MATNINGLACISSNAPPRISEKSSSYIAGVNGGILQLGAAPPMYQRTFVAAVPDTLLSTVWTSFFTVKNAGTVIDLEGHGVAAKAVLLDFDWDVGIRTNDGTTDLTIVTITALLAFAVP